MKKFFIILVCFMFLLPHVYALEKKTDKEVSKTNSKRDLLTKIRGGDYAHPGEEEAINLVLKKLKDNEKIKEKNTLDVGAGYGGTADYIKKKGFKKIWGVDKDENAVKYASTNYPAIKFFHLDARDLTKKFRKDFFSFIYMFNVIYAIPEKEILLKNIAKISEPGALLVIFDYTKLIEKEVPNPKNLKPKPLVMKDFAGNIMYPVEMDKIQNLLAKTGWKTIEASDIPQNYIAWYEKFLTKISSQREELQKNYKATDIEEVENLFGKILFNLRNEKIGGCLIIAKKI